jgi:hypothetical protein
MASHDGSGKCGDYEVFWEEKFLLTMEIGVCNKERGLD